ncbi:NTP transferase domain-containing protein [Rhizobium sp. M1]|uniref:cytidylyltransferase domain-containing protein n=1 Tax=Rhizobium sp. M1 TaxID=2035453 RepID=UPI000BEAD87A|nr:NTP transferase domain-containing protein [Rhizobium sp. M1]PDT07175.1 3-deoxy-manno-octulosonate cytidylyltransferase [Rhizobium sp. M1]
MKVIGLIPAHLASVRFPRKILFPFHDVPMIEHVRRRALMAEGLDEVYVATCDEEIATTVASSGGNVIMTAKTHQNGTNRCAEAAEALSCTHILLLQGDEPLLLPRHISAMIAAMRANPEGDAWNATAPINEASELDRHSFVKCALGIHGRINFCFRRSPSIASFEAQQTAIRKILGMIGFRRDYLITIAAEPATTFEKLESIEQMRIVETGGFLTSVPVDESLPSVNEPAEAQQVLDYVQHSEEQANLLRRVLAW